MELKDSIAIHVNGDLRHVTVGITLADMLTSWGSTRARSRSSAISRSFRAATFEEVRVEEGDGFEIVHFVGGG